MEQTTVNHVSRILDANANRARETLRVMEEAARFILQDASLSKDLKTLRHDLAAALSSINGLETHRDTPGDVGTDLTTPGETNRRTIADVAIAAGKRLGEALRTLEEYAKVPVQPGQKPVMATTIEQLRYRGYDLEKRLNLALDRGRAKQWRLCLLLTESLCTHHTWPQVLDGAIDGGVDCVQLREKSFDAAKLLARAQAVVEYCHKRNVCAIINDRPDIALLSRADGVHLGQTDLPCSEARRLVGRQLLIGVSTSNLEQARRALRDGADYCGAGPMFTTTTKHKDILVGPAYIREYTAWGRLPHLAIGGITPENIKQLTTAGVGGIAVSSAVCTAKNPANVVRSLLEQL